jgi:putative ABC transport system ATP-binding protein
MKSGTLILSVCYNKEGKQHLIRLENLSKIYGTSDNPIVALHDANLTIQTGEFIGLYGRSGSGKSTLLNLISGIDLPSAGKIFVDEFEVTAMDENRLTLFRRDAIGFVFQFFNLLPTLSVLENVLLPAQLRRHSPAQLRERGMNLLAQLGIADRWKAWPDQLSGGQQQRVAITRALINDPKLILADEPTGNLDSETGLHILEILKTLSQEQNKTILLATHSLEAARFADRVFLIKDGALVAQPAHLRK